MSAVTGFIAIVSLLLALAAGGGAAKPQVGNKVSTANPPAAGPPCPDAGCGINHNETLVRDTTLKN